MSPTEDTPTCNNDHENFICPKHSNLPRQEDKQLRGAINAIFTEYDKPSTTKTYPGQKSRVRRGAAIDAILALNNSATKSSASSPQRLQRQG